VGAPLRVRRPASEARFHGRLHSLRRDSAAVRHHYDVPTDFYRLVLGPTLVYSCAYFESADMTLDEAQEAKLDLICRKLDLRPGERFLDVGCGWGSLVLHAARSYGVQATGVTLSPSQADEARRRIAEAGMSDLCRVEVLDYRSLEDGPYDKVASIGMYEHVGRDQLPAYAAKLRSLLRPGGRLLNHGIARTKPGRVGAFINRYVFPDGDLQPVDSLLHALQDEDFEVRHVETLREHYATTLRHWVANLDANRSEAVRLAGSERERVWRLYMTGSAQAFEDGDLGVYQTLAYAGASSGTIAQTATVPTDQAVASSPGSAVAEGAPSQRGYAGISPLRSVT
jgi:cyclopropane-fatty-acyl-phospholipid synthase